MSTSRFAPGFLVPLAALLLMAGNPLAGQERVEQRRGGPRPSARDSAEAARHVYQHLLLRDRRSRLLLERARHDLESGNIPAGLEVLQHVLDRPGDGFVWLENAGELSSLRSEAQRMLTGSGREVIETYGRLYSPEADRLLLEARRTGDSDRFREVARRFFHTPAGFEATDWLAARWLDRGNSVSAARAWSRLRDEPVHQPRVTPELGAKAALAWHLAGDDGRARDALASLAPERLQIGGRNVSVDGWLTGLAATREGAAADPDWLMYLGSPARVRAVQATTPYPEPVWMHSFAEGQPDSLLRLLGQWETLQGANLQPRAVATHAVVVDGLVIVRDWSGLRALDLVSGKSAWVWQGATSLAEASRRVTAFDAAYQRRGLTVAPTAQPELDLKYALAGNSVHGTLASDGERVYLVELPELRWPRSIGRMPNVPQDAHVRRANRLIALPLRPGAAGRKEPASDTSPTRVQPVWVVGGPAAQTDEGDPPAILPRENAADESAGEAGPQAKALAGHFFLGPPLPLDGRLYAIAERDREVRLVVLDPFTGSLLWSQSLAGVDLPIEADVARHFRACTPSFGGGVLVCPVGHGLLVALDPFDGSLLWTGFCGDPAFADQPVNRRGAVLSRPDYGHSGFHAAPHVHGSRVVYLPPESDAVHCLDLASGNVHWTVPREDGEYVGALTDEVVLVVGREFCRGIGLETGEVRWQVRHGTPSGRGLSLGEEYLLPLEDGRVATIELSTGSEVGNSQAVAASGLGVWLSAASRASGTADEWLEDHNTVATPGNLVAAAGRIVSVGPRGVSVYRETGALRDELQERLRRQPESIRDQLLAAELELIQGRLDAAEALLLRVLSAQPDSDRSRAEGLLRELLYLRLDAGQGSERILARLEPLCRLPSERARFLLRKAMLALDARATAATLDTVREFAALDSHDLLADPDNPHWRMSASRWPNSVVRRLAAQSGEKDRPLLQARLAEELDAALDSSGTARLEQFLAVWAGWPGAAPARLELARRMRERGRLHQTELLLLEARKDPDPAVAAEATRQLATLWDARDLGFDAALLLDELATRFADVALADGCTGREFVRRFDAAAATESAVAQQSGEYAAVHRVRVSERLWWQNDPRITAVYRTHTPAYVTPVENPLQVLVSRGESGSGQLSVMNHAVGNVVSTVSLPLVTAYPAFSRAAYVGHFFPVGDVGSVSGVSLIESWRDKPLWTVTPRDLAGRTEVIRVGPAGPTFCAIQARRYLGVIDPASGELLWQRTDVNPTEDANFETADTIIGDDQVLVVFSADRLRYVAYETSTGRELRRGSLQVDKGQVQRSFGRRLVYLSSDPGGRRLKIWDPLTDTIEYESEAADLLISTSINDRELAFVLPSKPIGRAGLRPFSRLVIVDVSTAEVRVDIDLGAERLMHLNYLRAFRDGDRYYVNFQRAVANRGVRHYSYFATDTYLPSEHMQGDLYAIDARSGEVLWNRVIPQRSFVRLPGVRLPFLVALARARDRWNGGQQSLVLEVLDAATGETLGWKDDIFADRLGQFAWHPEQRRLELSGWHTTIRLDFGRDVIDLQSPDEPF